MRINDVNYGLYTYQNQVNKNKTNSNKSTNTDTVTISTKAQEISQSIKSDQADRQAKIQKLKQQIADGSYKADSQQVANKILDFWKK